MRPREDTTRHAWWRDGAFRPRLGVYPQDRFDHASLMHVFHGLVDLIEGIEGDQLVKRESALCVKIDESGDEEIRDGIACENPPNRSAVHDLIHVQADLCARGHDPEQSA